jgi:hypothetical protein
MHENRETSKTPAVDSDSRSAGEGLGRTARTHVSEESDRGIVPMNHSNKDGVSSAESEEGRLRIKENTSHSTRTRHRAGLRVSHGWGVCGQATSLAVIHPR